MCYSLLYHRPNLTLQQQMHKELSQSAQRSHTEEIFYSVAAVPELHLLRLLETVWLQTLLAAHTVQSSAEEERRRRGLQAC